MKKQYKCKVNGCISNGNIKGICGHKIVGNNDKCGAHGNTKCEHKIIAKSK